MPGIRFDFAVPAALVVLAFLVGTATALWYYRSTVPPVSRRIRFLLTALRTASFTSLLLLLGQPVLRLMYTSTEPPSLAVLIDNSTSMRVADRTGSRADKLRTFLRSPFLKDVARKATLHYYTFGLGLHPIPDPENDTLSLSEEATNFSSALQALAHEKESRHIDAALLITDGSPSLGRNPVYDAEAVGLPLYTVGIGDTTEPRDLLITRVVANQLVYSDVESPVDVTLKSSGYGGERIQVRLLQGTTELARQPVTLQAGTREYTVTLHYVPHGEGAVRFTVQSDVLPDELTPANNRSMFVARILKSKLRVIMLGGSPGPDVTLVGQTLREDKSVDLQVFTERFPSGFYERSLNRSSLDSADCFLFVGYPAQMTPAASFQLVVDAVTQRQKPLFLLAGQKVDYEKLGLLGSVVPFSVDVFAPTEQYVNAQIVEAEKLHPLVTLDRQDGVELWKRLPPLFRTLALFKARPESRTLVLARGDNTPANDPLILIRSVGKQKSLAITAYGLWRWRLMVQGDQPTQNFLAAFLSGAIKWLTVPEDSRPVRIVPTQDLFVRGEPAEFVGQVYDQKSSPVDDARITVSVAGDGRAAATQLRPLGNGRYEGSFQGLAEGEYTYRATAEASGSVIGSESGTLTIGGVSLELQDTRANFSLLRLLSVRTGGKFVGTPDIGPPDSLLTGEPWFVSQDTHRTTEIELWNWRYLLAGIVLLLAAEWSVRRVSGMI
jgi:hypothetical protein